MRVRLRVIPVAAATRVTLQRVLCRTSASAATATSHCRHVRRGNGRSNGSSCHHHHHSSHGCAYKVPVRPHADTPAPCAAAATAPDTAVVTSSSSDVSHDNKSSSSSSSTDAELTDEAVRRLRAALQALSEVEVAKALLRSDLPPVPTVLSTAATTTAAAAATLSSSPATATTTTTPPPASSSSSTALGWIRNKRPKFWALIRVATLTRNAAAAAKPSAVVDSNNNNSSSSAADAVASPSPLPSASVLVGGMQHVDGDEHSASIATTAAVTTTTTAAATTTAAPPRVAVTDARKSVALDAAMQPLRSHYKRNVAHALSAVLDRDPALGSLLLERLSADSRRLLLVMGTASEYFGEGYEKVAEQVKQADRDGDDAISATDYDEWARHSYQMCRQRQQQQQSSSSSLSLLEHSSSGDDDGGQASSIVASPVATMTPATAAPAQNNASSSTGGSQPTASHAASARIVQVLQRNVTPSAATTATAMTSSVTASTTAQQQEQRPSRCSALLRRSRLSAAARAAWSAMRRCLTGTGNDTNNYNSSNNNNNKQDTHASATAATTTTASTAASAGAGGATTGVPDTAGYIPWRTYIRLLFVAGTPFLAFGALDNSTLVLAGDTIDRTMSQAFGLSSMAAAGLGGVVSGVAGIQVHSLAERYTRAAPPLLSAAQRRSRSYERAEHWGNTLGMTLGLMLGMLPLLFLGSGTATTEARLRQDHDRLLREAERSRQRRLRALVHEQQSEHADIAAAQTREWRALQRAFAVATRATTAAADDERDRDAPTEL